MPKFKLSEWTQNLLVFQNCQDMQHLFSRNILITWHEYDILMLPKMNIADPFPKNSQCLAWLKSLQPFSIPIACIAETVHHIYISYESTSMMWTQQNRIVWILFHFKAKMESFPSFPRCKPGCKHRFIRKNIFDVPFSWATLLVTPHIYDHLVRLKNHSPFGLVGK